MSRVYCNVTHRYLGIRRGERCVVVDPDVAVVPDVSVEAAMAVNTIAEIIIRVIEILSRNFLSLK